MAQIKKAGKNKIRVIGTRYENTLRVDEQTRPVIEALAPKIAYNSNCNRWDVYDTRKNGTRTHTTLQRAVVQNFNKKLTGSVVFENGDNCDFRRENLVA
jgi:hypothetical protein